MQAYGIIVISDYGYRNKHEPMLFHLWDGRYLCGVNLNHKGMKELIIISCCLALAFVLSAIERLRLSMNRDNFKLDDPEKLTDSLKEYQDMMD